MAVRGDVETLYRQCAPAVYKYLLCLTHDQALAEDLTADTFERALSGFERFRGDCTPTAWLCAIAKRLWYGELRRKMSANMSGTRTRWRSIGRCARWTWRRAKCSICA